MPKGPIGSVDDPLADPYEDPSYSYDINTATLKKKEDSDSSGRVKGHYSYLDDVGEPHQVNYQATAEGGFEVTNSVPDPPNHVGFGLPLFKTDHNARGKIAFQRGPKGQYKFLAAGPDQRRAETTGPDGLTRGSYTYLDDQGLQRSVEYIAGPGIGYRVVSSNVGPSIVPPTIPTFSIPTPPISTIWPSASPFEPNLIPSSPTSTIAHPPTTSSTGYIDFTSPEIPASSSGGLDYNDIEGLKPPPSQYNPYDGAYVTFQHYGDYKPLSTHPTIVNTQHFPPHYKPSWNGKVKGRVINIDIHPVSRAPSPGDQLRRETHGDITKCQRGKHNDFTCTFGRAEEEKEEKHEGYYKKRNVRTSSSTSSSSKSKKSE